MPPLSPVISPHGVRIAPHKTADELSREVTAIAAELQQLFNERQWRLVAALDRAAQGAAANETVRGQSSTDTPAPCPDATS